MDSLRILEFDSVPDKDGKYKSHQKRKNYVKTVKKVEKAVQRMKYLKSRGDFDERRFRKSLKFWPKLLDMFLDPDSWFGLNIEEIDKRRLAWYNRKKVENTNEQIKCENEKDCSELEETNKIDSANTLTVVDNAMSTLGDATEDKKDIEKDSEKEIHPSEDDTAFEGLDMEELKSKNIELFEEFKRLRTKLEEEPTEQNQIELEATRKMLKSIQKVRKSALKKDKTRSKIGKAQFWTPELEQLKKQNNQAKKKHKICPSQENKAIMYQAHSAYKRALRLASGQQLHYGQSEQRPNEPTPIPPINKDAVQLQPKNDQLKRKIDCEQDADGWPDEASKKQHLEAIPSS